MNYVIENLEILDAGAEGMAVGRSGEQVVFVPFVVPGDIIDVQITRKKRRFLEGKAVRLHHLSAKRVEPHCSHFGICGGCRWQNMKYEDQLFYKEKQVYESLTRIGKLENPHVMPIHPSPQIKYYRNKLDFTFSNHRWLTEEDRGAEPGTLSTDALGFHVPQFFDKVVDIRECFHQRDPSNAIRNAARDYAIGHGLGFYDVRIWRGFLRNLIIRTTENGGLMVILVVREPFGQLFPMLDHLAAQFPEITSLYYVINPKQNDALYDQEFRLYKGDPFIIERIPPYRVDGRATEFRIGPLSFFQTNTQQAINLYRTAADLAMLRGDELVYDLYTGTGTIANYIAPYAGHVIGIETVAAAVADATENSRVNGISNTTFFAGETEKVMTPAFLESNGKPEIIITDPPRNGMHEKVVQAIRSARPEKIVYVSCNPATQARDIALLSEVYSMEVCHPFDMFPHTHHVENIALLRLKEEK